MPSTIFLNYRRSDAQGFAHALYANLERAFGKGHIFMDAEGIIKPGDLFETVLIEEVKGCEVFLAVIGPAWVNSFSLRPDGAPDYVEVEIKAALDKPDALIVPVIVGDAAIPSIEQIPPRLQPLLTRLLARDAAFLRPNRFGSDCNDLIATLKEVTAKRSGTKQSETSSLEPRGVLKGHSGEVTYLAASSDAQTIISGSEDLTVRVWDATTTKERGQLKGHAERIKAICYSEVGNTIATLGDLSSVRTWNSQSLKPRSTLADAKRLLVSMAMSADARRIVAGGNDGTLHIWDKSLIGRQYNSLKCHLSAVTCVALDSASKRIFTGSRDKSIKVWSGSLREVARLSGHSLEVRSVAVTSGSTRIFTASQDVLRVWNGKTFAEIGSAEGALHIALSPSGRNLLVVCSDGSLKMIDAESLKELWLEKWPALSTTSVLIPKEGRIITGDWKGNIQIWEEVHRKGL